MVSLAQEPGSGEPPTDAQRQARQAEAERLTALGCVVYACVPGSKAHGYSAPLPDSSDGGAKFLSRNLWVRARPKSEPGLVFLDVDHPGLLAEMDRRAEAGVEEAQWVKLAPRVLTRHGAHLYVRAPEGVSGWSAKDYRGREVASLRATANHGVVGPTSIHVDDGSIYTWAPGRQLTGWDQLPELPADWLRGLPLDLKDLGTTSTAGSGRKSTESPGAGPDWAHRTLKQLLDDPPAEGGRNDWLALVLGKAALKFRQNREAYDRIWEQACESLTEPLPEREAQNLLENIWEREQAKKIDSGGSVGGNGADGSGSGGGTGGKGKAGGGKGGGHESFTPDNGGLVFDARRQAYLYLDKDLGDQPIPGQWGMVCTAEVVSNGRVRYMVDLYRPTKFAPEQVSLDEEILHDKRRITKWLVGHRIPTTLAAKDSGKAYGHMGERLAARFIADKPTTVTGVACAGWYQLDGAGGAGGAGIENGSSGNWEFVEPGDYRVPDIVRQRAADLYLYDDSIPEQEALQLWRTSMDWQEPGFVAVVSAWLCAAATHDLSGSDLRPILSVQAPKGAGKSKGYLAFAIQQLGVASGWTGTFPTIRDALSTVSNSMVAVDEFDMNGLHPKTEQVWLRMGADGATASKKSQDRTSSESAAMVASLVVCGENSHPVDAALRERTICLTMPDASSRTVVVGGQGEESSGGAQVPQWGAEIVPALQQHGHGTSRINRTLGRGSRHLVRAVWQAGRRLGEEGRRTAAGLVQECLAGTEVASRRRMAWEWLVWGALVNQQLLEQIDAEAPEGSGLDATLRWVRAQVENHANEPHSLWAGLAGMVNNPDAWLTWDALVKETKQRAQNQPNCTERDIRPGAVAVLHDGTWYVRPNPMQDRLHDRAGFSGRRELERVALNRPLRAVLKEAGAESVKKNIRVGERTVQFRMWQVPTALCGRLSEAAGIPPEEASAYGVSSRTTAADTGQLDLDVDG